MNSVFVRCFILAAIILCENALYGVVWAVQSDVINVRDFPNGTKPCAMGDGKTDDTAAIQAAADLAAQRTVRFQPKRGAALGSYLGSSPQLYFPAGHYIVSDEIKLGPYSNIASDGKAIIEAKDSTKDVFVFPGGFTISVRGLRFLGGARQIVFDNRNIDGTIIKIEDCEFQWSSGVAIYTHGTTSAEDVHMSANLMITGCKFIMPRQVLRNVCDYAILRDCWVSLRHTNFTPDSAAFINTAGVLMFDNMIGVPDLMPERNQPDAIPMPGTRWVDNYGSLLVSRSRFGGEGGGIPIVHHFGQPDPAYPFMGQTVQIENSWIASGPNLRPDAGVITLREGVPQLIRLVGNSYLIDRPYIRVDGLDLKQFFARYANADKRFQVVIEHNMAFPKSPEFPVELERFRR